MYCSHCGTAFGEQETICANCGTSCGTQEQPTGGGKATASLVCGIVSWLTFGGAFILPTIGLILGILGLNSAKRGVATTGIVLNATSFMLLFFVLPLIALLLPAIFAAREAASRTQCVSNMRHVGVALHAYREAHGAFPPLYTVDEEGNPLHSWRVLMLPFMEQQHLYMQIRLDEPWDSEHNRQFHHAHVWGYQCPRNHPSHAPGMSVYSAIAGGAFVPATEAGSVTGLSLEDFTSGLSNTVALVEVIEPFNWMNPGADVTVEDFVQGNRVGSHHPGGKNVVLMDGAVRFISSATNSGVLRRLALPKESAPDF